MDAETDVFQARQAEQAEVDRLLENCPETTEAFVRRHSPWMLMVARRMLRDHAAAEDIVQETFAKAFQNLTRFEGRSTLKTWLHRIVVNQALMSLRKSRRQSEESLDDLMPQFDSNACRIEDSWPRLLGADEICEQRQLRDHVRAAIDRLPDSYRTVLLLRDIEGLSTAEVAEALELSETNVKVRLHRARSALKTLLEPVLRGQLG